MNVTPAILPKSFEEISDKLDRLSGFAIRIQIDLCDGKMGRELTWLPEGNEVLPNKDTIEYECDLMVMDWRTYVPRVLSLGMKRLVVHIDDWSEVDMDEFVGMIGGARLPIGLAVSNDMAVEEFDNKVRYIRERYKKIFIQVMGIEQIGEQGQLFDESCLERIRHSKQTFGDLEVQVDGAMRPETGVKVAGVGAETLVVGSYLLRHDDIGTAFSELTNIESGICQ